MRALMLAQTLQWTDCPAPEPRPGEALIRVRMAGICNTDLELLRGYAQFRGIPGHEFVGEVVCAPDAPEWVARRVVGEINVACGACHMCRAGYPTHCLDREALGIRGRAGAFAEYLTLPVRNLHTVPQALPDDVAVFTEPLAAACEILEQVHVHPSDRVVVIGDGKLGLLCAQVLSLTGCDVTLLGHHREKLDIVARMGIETALRAGTLASGADVVVEATGHPGGYAAAQRLVRPRGSVVLKSTYHGDFQSDLTTAVVDEVTLIGSRCGPFAPALRLLGRGLVDVRPLIHARYAFDDALAAFDHAARPGALKVLLDFEDGETV
ncbi:MAG: alcohol dehydrogenase catalytic domain-containing protein [Anaerolineae bacterium]|nr:alcohol dehydrogenase catalytic domain-containing protein [Anaerolineae bacterium]